MENEIAISGTGIAGLATATAIIAADHDCVLFGPPAQKMRGGVQLAPNGWAALSVLGLAQDVLSRATRLHEITVRSLTDSATLARLPLKDVYASVARADLVSIFKQKIEHSDRFRRHNTTVEQASQKKRRRHHWQGHRPPSCCRAGRRRWRCRLWSCIYFWPV